MFERALGEGVSLAMWEHRMAGELFALVDAERERLAEWLPWPNATRSEGDSLAFIEGVLMGYAKLASRVFALRCDGQLAGVCGFNVLHHARGVGEVGYWIGSGFEGRGVMTRAVRGLCAMGFEELGLKKVQIAAATGNARSRAIPQRLGFQQEGVIRRAERLGDRCVDHVIYGLLASEWEGVRGS